MVLLKRNTAGQPVLMIRLNAILYKLPQCDMYPFGEEKVKGIEFSILTATRRDLLYSYNIFAPQSAGSQIYTLNMRA